jgi:hypothetical protein
MQEHFLTKAIWIVNQTLGFWSISQEGFSCRIFVLNDKVDRLEIRRF